MKKECLHCSKKAVSRGLCSNHYQQKRNEGTLTQYALTPITEEGLKERGKAISKGHAKNRDLMVVKAKKTRRSKKIVVYCAFCGKPAREVSPSYIKKVKRSYCNWKCRTDFYIDYELKKSDPEWYAKEFQCEKP